jgi:hypothetical protein
MIPLVYILPSIKVRKLLSILSQLSKLPHYLITLNPGDFKIQAELIDLLPHFLGQKIRITSTSIHG